MMKFYNFKNFDIKTPIKQPSFILSSKYIKESNKLCNSYFLKYILSYFSKTQAIILHL